MVYKIISAPELKNDLHEATKWYIEINNDLARRFIVDFEKVKNYILLNPKKIAIKYGTTRIAYLESFPFGIHYKLAEDLIILYAVFHTSEDPNKWKTRKFQPPIKT